MKKLILCHSLFLRRILKSSSVIAVSMMMLSTFFLQAETGAAEKQFNKIKVLFDQRSPMRDGTELSNDIYLPKKPGRYPTLLMRTPYNKGGRRMDLPWDFTTYFAERGYDFVFQDVRGRGDSDGEFNYYHADIEDGYDSVEWAASQPWSNGKVCMFGLSYMGGVQWQAAKTKPPHLECLVSTAAAGDIMNEVDYGSGGTMAATSNLAWHFGVSRKVWHEQLFVDLLRKGNFDWEDILWHRPLMTMDEKAFGFELKHWREILNHPTEDAHWKNIKLQPDDFKNIEIPVLHITGWFDDDQKGSMYFWRGMQKYSRARDKQFMLIGPWGHVQTFFGGGESIGEMKFGPEPIVDPLAQHLEFFDHHLKGKADSYDHPKAKVYITGANEWREYNEYPPGQAKEERFYLHSGGNANSLKGDGSLKWKKSGSQATDHYTFDPKNPVPTFADDKQSFYGADFRAVEAREDVLVYTSDVLGEALDVVGTVSLELYASSDALDTDFFVKVLDVYPDGRAVRLGPWGGGLRARYRNGFEKEELLTPGKVEKFTIELDEIGHRFLPGHRIRIEVSSSSYPFFLPNQNTGNPVATDTEWKTAHQTVYHNRKFPSALVVPVIEITKTE